MRKNLLLCRLVAVLAIAFSTTAATVSMQSGESGSCMTWITNCAGVMSVSCEGTCITVPGEQWDCRFYTGISPAGGGDTMCCCQQTWWQGRPVLPIGCYEGGGNEGCYAYFPAVGPWNCIPKVTCQAGCNENEPVPGETLPACYCQ